MRAISSRFRSASLFAGALVGLGLVGCGGSTSDTADDGEQDTGAPQDSSSGDTGAQLDSGGKDTNGGADTATGGDTTGTDGGGDSTATDTAAGSDTAGTDTAGADATGTDTTGTDTATTGDTATTHAINTVFVIMMENHSWSDIKGSTSAPYINGTLLDKFAHAENYKTPPGNHPSEPNYIWLEAGDNLSITDDGAPSANHKSTTSHLVTQLETAGISWKSYQEDIDTGVCPLSGVKEYAPKHNPMVFFDDVTDTNSTTSAHCIAHVKPYTVLATDLASAATTARYNFITPNLCNDMHGEAFTSKCGGSFTPDLVKMGDDWLKSEIPKIQASDAYKAGGVIFVVWDEGSGLVGGSDGPIGMIVVSSLAKVKYSNSIAYTHSSTLKTIETIFGVPLIRGAAASGTTDLRDLFTAFP